MVLKVDRFRPTTRRQRLGIIAAAVATVVILWLLLLYRPGGNPRRYVTQPAPCAQGQSSGCIGGQADVLLLPGPAPSAASAP